MPLVRRKVTFCLAVISMIGLSGCPSGQAKKTQTATPLFRGQQATILAPRSLRLPVIWELLMQEWSEQSGAATQFVEYEVHQSAPDFVPEGKNADDGLIIFPFNRLCDIDTRLTRLHEKSSEIDSREIFKGLRDRVCAREGQVVANPISVPVLLCYVRKDLLKSSGRSLPHTWDEYHQLVETLNDWAPGLTAVEPLSPEFRATTFFARSLAYCKHPENYSVWFDIDSAKPTLTTPGFVKGLEVAQRTWKQLAPESTSLNPADCRRLLFTGKAAIALTFEPSGAELVAHPAGEPRTPDERVDGIEIVICRLPGSLTVYNRNSKRWDHLPAASVHAPALCGFAGLAMGVVPGTNHVEKNAATNLMASISTAEMFDQAFAALPKGPCRESQLTQSPAWFGPELSAEEAGLYCDAVAQSLRDSQLVFELPVSDGGEFRQVASAALEGLLTGKADVQSTLDMMQQGFEAIVEHRGWQAVRDSHRRGLGLAPAPKK